MSLTMTYYILTRSIDVTQCPKLRFYLVHPPGAFLLETVQPGFSPCTLLICSDDKIRKNVHTPGAHLRKSCTRPRKCAHRVQGAPLISDTVTLYLHSCIMLVPAHETTPNRLTLGVFCEERVPRWRQGP